MEVRSAAITVDEDRLMRAITSHLATVVLGQLNTNEDYEGFGAYVEVQIDGEQHKYSILHVVTEYTMLSGVVLHHVDFDEEASDSSLNTLQLIMVRFNDTEQRVEQRLYSMNERDAVMNKNGTALAILEKLYTE